MDHHHVVCGLQSVGTQLNVFVSACLDNCFLPVLFAVNYYALGDTIFTLFRSYNNYMILIFSEE